MADPLEKVHDTRGLLIVLSGPSGVGKNSIIDRVREMRERTVHSVSMTTRAPRAGEVDGVAYHFTTKARFEALIEQGDMLEYDEYCGAYYGTPRRPIDAMNRDNIDVLLDLTVKGALALKQTCPNAVIIFVLPPSEAALTERLTTRGTEPPEVVRRRILKARDEFRAMREFDYWVLNDVVDDAARRVNAIIDAEKHRISRLFVDDMPLKPV